MPYTWNVRDSDGAGLAFDHAVTLLARLDGLRRRPRLRVGERLLPVVHLLKANDAPSAVAALTVRLDDPRVRRRSPWVCIDRAGLDKDRHPDATELDRLRGLLAAIIVDLGKPRRREIGFPRFGLVVWALSVELERADHTARTDPDTQIDEKLREHLRRRRSSKSDELVRQVIAGLGEAPWYVRMLLPLVVLLGARVALGHWRALRWFRTRTQPGTTRTPDLYQLVRSLNDHRPDSSETSDDERHDVHRLLVEAFLEDLREAFRRSTILGTGRRRSCYPYLLLQDVCADEPARKLLELVCEIRTRALETESRNGRREAAVPLLIVGECGNQMTEHQPLSPAGAPHGFRVWAVQLKSTRQWIVEFELPVAKGDAERAQALGRLRRIPDGSSRFSQWRPAWRMKPGQGLERIRRNWTPGIAGGVLVAAAGFVPLQLASSCWTNPFDSWNNLDRLALPDGSTECVGITTDATAFAPGDPELAKVAGLIDENNAQALRNPGHTTVVYFGALTADRGRAPRNTLEELRGIVTAQHKATKDARLGQAPIRILYANAGFEMNHARVAADKVAELHRKTNGRVAAVIGMGISRRPTLAAIERLDSARLLVVGTATSADDMPRAGEYYRQIPPDNRREGAVAAYFLKHVLHLVDSAEPVEEVTIVHPYDPDDIYSANLASRVEASLRVVDVGVVRRRFRVGATPRNLNPVQTLGRQACSLATRRDHVVFFAGRHRQFNQFVAGMDTQCEGSYPRILAGDDVTKFVLDGAHHLYPGLRMHYFSFASSAGWSAPDCREGEPASFKAQYRALFRDDCR